MRYAGQILTKTLDYLESQVKPGISTQELDDLAEAFIRQHEGCIPGFKGQYGFPGSVCFSINNEVVHGLPTERQLRDGDIIGMDCGVKFKDLHTDACRTVAVGEVDYDALHLMKITKKALKEAVKLVKPGNRIGDLSAVIQKTLEDQGYAPVLDCTGHGVGYELHEPPEIMNAGVKGTGPEMRPGMVLAIEPISTMGTGRVHTANDQWTVVSSDDTLSAHFEHTILVTEEGCEVLAK